MTIINTQKLLHRVEAPIRWGDLDAMGHLNNTLYFRLMEECRVQWFVKTGTHLTPQSELAAVVVAVSAEFLRPITYPATVVTSMFLGARGTKSVETLHTMEVGGELYARGMGKLVWIDARSGKSVPVPERVATLYD